jgi:SpoVK/Ycf46/Vps4 family AAA+-type ATPase
LTLRLATGVAVLQIDGLAGSRQDGGSGAPSVEERVLSQLLSEMDGLLSRQVGAPAPCYEN